MKRKSEQTLGKYLATAQNLANTLAGFSNFKSPAADVTLEQLNQIITDIDKINAVAAAKKSIWSLTIEERQKIFDKEKDSVKSLLRPIRLAVRAQYGTNSKHATDVSGHVKNMRPRSVMKKTGATSANATAVEESTGISRSHRSKGSITKSFSDLVSAIAQFTPAFEPGNEAISMQSLLVKHQQLVTVSDKLNSNYAEWKTAMNRRNEQYSKLKDCFIRLKNAVDSQYGKDSTEYSLIKHLAI